MNEGDEEYTTILGLANPRAHEAKRVVNEVTAAMLTDKLSFTSGVVNDNFMDKLVQLTIRYDDKYVRLRLRPEFVLRSDGREYVAHQVRHAVVGFAEILFLKPEATSKE